MKTRFVSGERKSLLEPLNIDDKTWCYTSGRTLEIVREVRMGEGKGTLITTQIFKIPMRKLESVLRREK